MTFSVTILGSSSATPTSTRNPSGLLVNMDYKYFLMDCGEGTQMQLRRYHYKLQKIKHIFISHLHGDHFFGLIGLISTLHLLGRKDELHVFANEHLQEIIQLQLRVSGTELSFPLFFHPTDSGKPQVIYEDEERYIKSFPLSHRIPTTGFLFCEKEKPRKVIKEFLLMEDVPVAEIPKIKAGADFINANGKIFKNADITKSPPKARSFAYCSDTGYFEAIIPEIRNVDLLYHEATFASDMEQVANEKFHSTAGQAATIAKKADVGELIISHFSARYKLLEVLLEEARSVFPNTQLAEDGKIFGVRQGGNEETPELLQNRG
jgi:ribonuclease Z